MITALVEKAKDDAPELVDRNIFKLMSSWADQLASNSVEVFSQIRDKPPGSKQEKIFMKLVNSVIGTATAAGIVDKITPILTKLSKTRS